MCGYYDQIHEMTPFDLENMRYSMLRKKEDGLQRCKGRFGGICCAQQCLILDHICYCVILDLPINSQLGCIF